MKLSNSENTVKCLHDKGSRGSRKKRLPKLLSLMLATVLIASAVVGDTGIGTVKAGTDVMMIIENANGSDNLEDYIPETGGMVLQKKDLKTGEWVDVNPEDDIVLGSNYKLKVHFVGGDDFQKVMHWSLGKNVKCQPKKGAPIMNDGAVVGTYDLDENGNVTVYFDDDYLKKTNQVLDMEFEMIPTKNEGDDDYKFPWSGHIQYSKVISDAAKLGVQKTAGSYDVNKGTITYTVEATVTEGMVTNGKLEDVMGEGLTFHDVNSMKVFDADGRDVTSYYQDYIDKLTELAEQQEKAEPKTDKFTLEPLPPLSEGMRFVVEYESDVAKEKQQDKEYVAQNKVTFSGKKPSGDPADPKTAEAKKEFSKDQLSKSGSLETIDGEEKEVIKWQIKVGSGQWDPFSGAENGTLTLKDTLGKGLDFYRGKEIKVEWCDKDGSAKGNYEIGWDKVSTSTNEKNEKVADYKLEKEKIKGYDWQEGDYIIVTYYTDFKIEDQPTSGFKNTVENEILKPGDKATGTVPVGESIQKTVEDHEEQGYLTYTVTVDIPPASHMKSMQDDDEDGHPTLNLPYYYIQDRLDFSGGEYYVLNVPEDVTIYVVSKDGTYSEWFEKMPCTSGSGDSTITEQTFQILQGAEDGTSNKGEEHREFRIYFNVAHYGIGTEGKLEHHDSIWDLNFPTTMTITYRIPYDATVVDKDGKIVEQTLGELLMQGKRLDNQVLAKRSGVRLAKEVPYQKTPKPDGIEKSARYLGDGVVEYRVSFLNDHHNFIDWHTKTDKDTDEQDLKYGGHLQSPSPTSKLITVSFEDQFDQRMEYVKGSLYVDVCNESGNKYATYQYTGSGPVFDESPDRLLVENILDFGKQTWNDGELSTSHYVDKPFGVTFNQSRKYVFVYQLRLKDAYRGDWSPIEVENTAALKYDGTELEDSTTIEIPSDMLQKKYELKENGIIEYTLNVNSTGANLVTVATDEGVINLNSYRLEDEMSSNLELIRGADGNYDISVQYRVKGSEEWRDLTQSPSTTDISMDNLNYYVGTEDDGKLYFILPDELAIRITYKVLVNGPVNSQEVASNTATLYADHTETDHRSVVVEVGDSRATASSDPPVHLDKKDAADDSLLSRAEFTFYSSVESSEEEVQGSPINIMLGDEPITMYPVRVYVTDELGGIRNITYPKAKNDETSEEKEKRINALYALIETKAPDGYILNPAPQFFRFPGAKALSNEVVTYNEKEYDVCHAELNETFSIKNEKKQYLRIFKINKEKEEGLLGAEFTLFECAKDENGSWQKGKKMYTGHSVTDGTVEWSVGPESGSEQKNLLDLSKDLPDGTYYLEETESPSGYKPLDQPIIISIEKGSVASCTLGGKELTPFNEGLVEDEDGVKGYAIAYKVENEKQLLSSLRIIKTNMSGARLQGAEFVLYAGSNDGEEKAEDRPLWFGTSSSDGIVLWYELGEDPLTSEKFDKLELSPGTYSLKESQAPDGYTGLEGMLTVTVTEDGEIKISGSNIDIKDPEKRKEDGTLTIEYSIPNSDGYALPETGGQGYAYLYLLGGIFTVLGVVFLLNKKRVYAKRS